MEHADRTAPAEPTMTTGGEGEGSYTRNSQVQGTVAICLHPILKESILHNWSPPKTGPIHYADFGCAVGANTIGYAKVMAESLKSIPEVREREVMCYFCDLPSNDFNTLFNQFPPLGGQSGSDRSAEERTWFAAGVPGTLFNRMFPRSSLHIVVSTLAIQYLHEIPKSIRDKSSPAYNKGRIWVQGSKPEVAAAYTEASRKGLRMFFEHRAEEVAAGGLLALVCPGRIDRAHPENQFPTESCLNFNNVLQETWQQLVDEGIIPEELLDSFNVPICFPSLEDIQEAVEQPTSAFHIQKLEFVNVQGLPDHVKETLFKDAESYTKFHKNLIVGGTGSVISNHLGPELFEKLMDRLGHNHMQEYPRWKRSGFPTDLKCCIAILIRK